MKTFMLTLLLWSCVTLGLAQSPSDTSKFNNRFYKREIGIGVDGILNGNLGSALVLKIRDDRSKLVPVSYSKYWRFQAGWYLSGASAFSDRFEGQAYNYEHFSRQPNEASLRLCIGRERNNFYGRFNFYYGWDAQLSLRRDFYLNGVGYQDNSTSGSQYLEYYRKTFEYGARGYGFLGVKYHFSNRISLSIESAVYLGYILSRGQTIAKETYGVQINGRKWTGHQVEYGIEYLRFATLNYHFRRH